MNWYQYQLYKLIQRLRKWCGLRQSFPKPNNTILKTLENNKHIPWTSNGI